MGKRIGCQNVAGEVGLGTLTALRHKEYRWLFVGLSASSVGLWMQQFAVGWLVALVAVREGSPERAGFYVGIMSLATAAPSTISGLLAGVYADRTDRRNLLMVARVMCALSAAVLALVVITGHAQLTVVILLSIVSTTAFAVDPPGRMAMLPSLVPARDLFSAIGLTRAMVQTAHIIGPLVGGLLVTPIGVAGILAAKAGLDGLSAIVLRLMKPQPVIGPAQATSVLDSLREGLGHIHRDRVIRSCLHLQVVFVALGMAYVQLLPALAVDALRVEALQLSWLIGAGGAGSVVGAVALASTGRVQRRGRLMLVSMLLLGALVILLGLSRGLGMALLILVVIGVMQQLFLGTQSVVLALAAPEELRGRVMGIQSVVFHSVAPVGVFVLGVLGSFIGISNALVAGGAIVVATALFAMLFMPTIRDLTPPWHEGTYATIVPGVAADPAD